MVRCSLILAGMVLCSSLFGQDFNLTGPPRPKFDLTKFGAEQTPVTPTPKVVPLTPVKPKEDAWIYALAKDPRTMWYDKRSLPGVYESSGRLYAVGYNIAGNLDKTGTANNEHPWAHTGGLDNCGPDVNVKRMLWIPEKSKIKLRNIAREIKGGQRNGLDYSLIMGKFPEGTVSAEFMYEGLRMFEARTRTKTNGSWETNQFEYGDKPKGYVAVTSCVECHEDIGKHSFQIDPKRDWYATVRGLEVGGPIHWHPWKTKGAGGNGLVPIIRDELKEFVEYDR